MKITDDMKYQHKEKTDLYDMLKCFNCNCDITYDDLLNKHDQKDFMK